MAALARGLQPPRSEAGGEVFEAVDTSVRTLRPARLIRGVAPRDLEAVSARLGEQFVSLNREAMRLIGAQASLTHTGRSVEVTLRTSAAIGAVPLTSPITGRPDLGLIVRPRFEWMGLGKVLSESGMRTLPDLLAVPALPRSDRRIPPWVLSSVVLARVEALLGSLNRKFEGVEAELTAPRGSVDWQRWANVRVASARPDLVPCRFPDLRADAEVLGFIHHVLRLQRAALEEQRSSGEIARNLLAMCERLEHRVEAWAPRATATSTVTSWLRRPLLSAEVRDGLTAGLWTIEHRGLAGTADLAGLPWRMDMELVFENWVVSMMESWAPRHGLALRNGQKRETVTPLFWEPPYSGSQKALIPDAVLHRPDLAVVVDAKYKSHWDELAQADRWMGVDEAVRDAHRDDLLQVLAYTTNQVAPRVIAVLLYPCRQDTWLRLKERNQSVNRASVASGSRRVDLVLAALPFTASKADAHELFDSLLTEF